MAYQNDKFSELLDQTFYQYVPVHLVVLAFMSYAPYHMWHKIVVADVKHTKTPRAAALVYVKHLLCGALALCSIAAQVYATDVFLGHRVKYAEFGFYVLGLLETEIEKPLLYVFPSIAKCTFEYRGTSNEVNTYDGICLLALNVLNRKTYLLMWLILALSILVISLGLVLNVLAAFSTRFRALRLIWRGGIDVNYEDALRLSKRRGVGGCFVAEMCNDNGFRALIQEEKAAKIEEEKTRRRINRIEEFAVAL